jgi:acyl-coenzyme A synthetase/AMP-(fatty) acid ligase
MIEFMLAVFKEFEKSDAIIWQDQHFTYGWMLDRVHYWLQTIREKGIKPGTVTILEADFSPNAMALFLALIEHQCILVPLTKSVENKKKEYIEIAQGEVNFEIDSYDNTTISTLSYNADHELYKILHNRKHPGLVLFSSGSTGKSKAIVHDMADWLEKYKTRRHQQRTITFLLFDHGGGVNTMLHVLSNGGCVITVQDRTPDGVLSAIEKYEADVLPTSPTFINLILLSEAYKRHDLSSLRIVTYGTEPMPESTLKRFHELFPNINLHQTYGLTEVGVMRSKSKSSDSLWVKVGGEGYDTRIVDGMLQIKARSAMLGYLNAPNPFTEDGWFLTGDEVEQDGEYFRFLGRRSEIINVGGQKVFPAEVESIIQEVDNVAEVTVFGEKNPITGSIVCAKVRLIKPEEPRQAIVRIKQHCAKKMLSFKVPVKITIAEASQFSERFKKIRTAS